ncbi:MAG TPA: hypothetical protein DEH00_04065 [Candidatus Marinimicrobia bacterium]|nr:hypothetical protein [Candidatus Neomarinimicrobiota bacterium]
MFLGFSERENDGACLMDRIRDEACPDPGHFVVAGHQQADHDQGDVSNGSYCQLNSHCSSLFFTHKTAHPAKSCHFFSRMLIWAILGDPGIFQFFKICLRIGGFD